MPETLNPVSPLLVSYICDECGEGGLVNTGTAFSTWPAKYQHICDHCGAIAILNECYPRVEYTVD